MVNRAWTVGKVRVDKIARIEEHAGYLTLKTGISSTDVDILVFKEDRLIRVYEVTNYSTPEEFVSLSRATRYRASLLRLPGEKIFVCSFEENLKHLPGQKAFFEDFGIKVEVIGHQDKREEIEEEIVNNIKPCEQICTKCGKSFINIDDLCFDCRGKPKPIEIRKQTFIPWELPDDLLTPEEMEDALPKPEKTDTAKIPAWMKK
jgi:hypothetical protein